jgi:predicted transcriptional regulator
MPDQPIETTLSLTAEIVAAHLSNNHLAAAEVPVLIASVHSALAGLGVSLVPAPEAPKYPPATTVRKSLADSEHIISMIDGKPYKMLKRHLASNGLTPDEYRARYGLKPDYPIIAPGYSEKRSAFAKSFGLGRKSGAKATERTPAEPKRHDRKRGSLGPQ